MSGDKLILLLVLILRKEELRGGGGGKGRKEFHSGTKLKVFKDALTNQRFIVVQTGITLQNMIMMRE